jgi:outer membrane PBP1 activator LpoA protein
MMLRRQVVLGMMSAAGAVALGTAARAQSGAVDRIGLLLPRSGGPFGRVNSAVRAGIEAAFHRDGGGLAVDIYEVDDTPQSLAAAYRGMLERSTALSLGPLSRGGVAALLALGEVPITTVALNQPEGEELLPWNVIIFTLAVEYEAQRMAAIAMQDAQARMAGGRMPGAIVVAAATPLGRRGAGAFVTRWRELGGQADDPLELEESALYKFRSVVAKESGDLYFLSMTASLARPVRTIIGRTLPVYGTSLLSQGVPNAAGMPDPGLRAPELDGVRLLEMPMILQPNYAAALGYASPPVEFSLEMQRLYALGIDAFRIARGMFSGRSSFEIDGMTGRLRFDGGAPLVVREPRLAEFRDGFPAPL